MGAGSSRTLPLILFGLYVLLCVYVLMFRSIFSADDIISDAINMQVTRARLWASGLEGNHRPWVRLRIGMSEQFEIQRDGFHVFYTAFITEVSIFKTAPHLSCNLSFQGNEEFKLTCKLRYVFPEKDYTMGMWTLLANKEKHVMMCAIAKNACTQWKAFFIQSHLPEFKVDMESPTSHGVHAPDMLFNFQKANLSESYESTMRNMDWLKAVFIRDPLERLLSAFLDKCLVANQNWASGNWCFGLDYFGEKKKPSFEDFAYVWMELYLHKRKHYNDHFSPQAYFCDLSYYYEEYRIIPYHRDTLHDLGLKFAKSIGLEEAYFGWGPHKNESILPKQSHSQHATNAGSRMKQHYTEKVARFLYSAYQIDYDIFNLEPPKQLPQEWFKSIMTPEEVHETALKESKRILKGLGIPDEYKLGEKGSHECPPEYEPITSVDECEDAAAYLGYTWQPLILHMIININMVCNFCSGCFPNVVRMSNIHGGNAYFICKSIPVID